MIEGVMCEACNGSGSDHYEEDHREISDVCYSCMGIGKVSEEAAHHAKIKQVADILATMHVDEARKLANQDPDGEGWGFRAAENMMSERDYTLVKTYEKSCDLMEEFLKLSQFAQEILIKAILPNKEVQEVQETNKVEESLEVIDDEIPF